MAPVLGVLAAVGGFVATYGSAILSAVSLAASLVMAFVPQVGPSSEGPRLNDATVMTSTYGIHIPRILGRCRVSGNMIWALDIEEVKGTIDTGKGDMFNPKSEQITYSYYGNFAMSFGQGDGTGCFAKLYADKKLIYDATGGSKAFFKYPEASLRFYLGGASQEPDPLIETDLGVGNVSAHRDLTYLVVENLPLKDFGNRIPHFEAEYDSSAEATYNKELTTGADLPEGVMQGGRYDKTTRQLYLVDGPSGASGSFAMIWRCDMDSNAQGAYIASTDPGPPYLYATEFGDAFGLATGGIFPHTDGKLFVAGHTTDGDGIARINPYTLEAMAAYRYSVFPPDGNGNFQEKASISFSRIHREKKASNYLLLAHNPETLVGVEAKIYLWDRDNEYIGGPELHLGSATAGLGFELNASVVDREGIVWVVGQDLNQTAGPAGERCHLVRVQVDQTLPFKLYGVPLADPSATVESEVIDLTSTGLHDPQAMAYDKSSHSLIIGGNHNSDNVHLWVKWDIASRTVVASRTFDEDVVAEQTYAIGSSCAQSWQMGTANGYLMAVCTGSGARVVRKIRAVDLSDEVKVSPDSILLRPRMLWDPAQNQAWFLPTATGGFPQLVQWERCVETPVPLESVITELVEMTRELGAADIDVTAAGILAQDLTGLIVGRQMPVRRALESLIFPFQLDVVESDAKLLFSTRHGTSSRTIPENDLGAQTAEDSKGKLLIDRSQEAEVPARMDLRYLDWDRDFLEGNQSAKRHTYPNYTQRSPEVAQLNVPVVMRASQAAQAVERGLFNTWVARTGYKLSLGTKHVDLDPTDVISVERGTDSFLMRLLEWSLEDGFVTLISASSEDEETYVSSAVGQIAPVPDQSFGPPGATELFVLDIPLLRDEDDPQQLGTGAYVAFGRHLDNWRAAICDRSLDGGARWDRWSVSRDSSPWGFTTAAVTALSLDPDNDYPSEIQRLDETTQITVYVVADEADLEEITRAELWTNQENAFAIGEGSAVELVRFQNFTDNGDGSFTFYNLLRGRRGTEEAAMAGHVVGSRVVFLYRQKLNREGIELARFNQTDLYRATSTGSFVEASVIQSHYNLGTDSKPYPVARPLASPVWTGASRAPVTITWTRRARLVGDYDLFDGLGQSENFLCELAESYVVVLLDKVDPTIEAVSKTSVDDAVGVTFDATDIVTTAHYVAGDLLNVVIYQISGIVGRGLPRPISL